MKVYNWEFVLNLKQTHRISLINTISVAPWIQEPQEAKTLASMLIETSTEQIILIASSCFLWKKKKKKKNPEGVEIFQKSVMDMSIS